MIFVKTLGRVNSSDNCHYSVFLCTFCEKECVKQTSNGHRAYTCGCQGKTAYRKNGHGDTSRKGKRELYHKWVNMKTRCFNPNASQAKWYSSKKISIYKPWLSYKTFKAWAEANGFVPNTGLALGRKDHEKGYTPDNCEFISISDNCREAMARRWGATDTL